MPGRGPALPLLLLRRTPWPPLRAGLVALGVGALLAVEITRAGLLPIMPVVPDPADPVVATVGDRVLRLSELRAETGDAEADIDDLAASGAVTRAADQLALALQAERDGLHEALEVRAALALARRRVLAEAYLDLAVRRATDERLVRAAYDAEVADTNRTARVSVRRAVFATEADAARARTRILRGASFERAARRARGALAYPPTSLSTLTALPDPLAARAAGLAAGAVSEPFETEEGWSLIRVEARSGEAVLPFEARRDAIRARLRAAALAEASHAAGLTGRTAAPAPRVLTRPAAPAAPPAAPPAAAAGTSRLPEATLP